MLFSTVRLPGSLPMSTSGTVERTCTSRVCMSGRSMTSTSVSSRILRLGTSFSGMRYASRASTPCNCVGFVPFPKPKEGKLSSKSSSSASDSASGFSPPELKSQSGKLKLGSLIFGHAKPAFGLYVVLKAPSGICTLSMSAPPTLGRSRSALPVNCCVR